MARPSHYFRLSIALIGAAVVLAVAACAPAEPESGGATTSTRAELHDVSARLQALEEQYDAHVGVAAIDTADGSAVTYRPDKRFRFASTLKAFVAADFLMTVPNGGRGDHVDWTPADVEAAGYAPFAQQHLDTGATLIDAAEAAVRQSDNAALNTVLDRVGGPSTISAMLHDLGDTTTRVVHREPELNERRPGSTDDTTTAAAFSSALAALLKSERLSADDRATLIAWMSGNATGDTLIRAGVPNGWTVAEKSGGADGLRNDIAVITPPGRAPVILTVFTEKKDPDAAYDDALVAATAKVVASALA